MQVAKPRGLLTLFAVGWICATLVTDCYSDEVTLTYDDMTGSLSIDGGAFGPVTSLQIVSSSGVFQGTPSFPVGDIFPEFLFYVTARAQDALPSVNLGPVMTPQLTTEFLLNDLCFEGMQRSPEGVFRDIESIDFNGQQIMVASDQCTIPRRPPVEPVLVERAAIMHYDSATGNLRVEAVQAGPDAAPAPMTTLQIESLSGIFSGEPAQNIGQSPWDIDRDTKIFKMWPNGFSSVDFGPVVETGLSGNQFHSDVCVSGSWLGGGWSTPVFAFPGAGLVPLASCSRRPKPRSADVILDYDPARGILTVAAEDGAGAGGSPEKMSTIQINSETGIFSGALAEELDGPFDRQSRYQIIKQDPDGFEAVSFGAVLEAGYSADFLATDLTIDVTFVDGQRLSRMLVAVPEPSSVSLLFSALLVIGLRKRHAQCV